MTNEEIVELGLSILHRSDIDSEVKEYAKQTLYIMMVGLAGSVIGDPQFAPKAEQFLKSVELPDYFDKEITYLPMMRLCHKFLGEQISYQSFMRSVKESL